MNPFHDLAHRTGVINLVKMESAVITAFAHGEGLPPMLKAGITNHAITGTALLRHDYAWKSRTGALAAIATSIRRFCFRRELTPADIHCAMGAIEAAWELDPDLTLTQCGGEMREAFDLWIEELTERERI